MYFGKYNNEDFTNLILRANKCANKFKKLCRIRFTLMVSL